MQKKKTIRVLMALLFCGGGSCAATSVFVKPPKSEAKVQAPAPVQHTPATRVG